MEINGRLFENSFDVRTEIKMKSELHGLTKVADAFVLCPKNVLYNYA
jgi:hypothetical protein